MTCRICLEEKANGLRATLRLRSPLWSIGLLVGVCCEVGSTWLVGLFLPVEVGASDSDETGWGVFWEGVASFSPPLGEARDSK